MGDKKREGVEVHTAIRSGDAAREIVNAVTELAVDLAVVGSKGLTGPAPS